MTDIQVVIEVTRVRAGWVEDRVVRRLNECHGEVMPEKIDAWEDEAYELWNTNHPALVGLLGTVGHG